MQACQSARAFPPAVFDYRLEEGPIHPTPFRRGVGRSGTGQKKLAFRSGSQGSLFWEGVDAFAFARRPTDVVDAPGEKKGMRKELTKPADQSAYKQYKM
ncbi:hypothetical protein MRX96_033354 [Rhipicephalus microplus]